MPDPDYSRIRLIVFDLDETLWTVSVGYCAALVPPYRRQGDSILDAHGHVLTLRPDARQTLEALRERGYRISAASRNHPVIGRRIMELLDVWRFFEHPCLEWQDKDLSVGQALSDFREKGPGTFEPDETLFIDDWPENLTAAARIGVPGLLFGGQIKTLSELLKLLPEKAPARQAG